MSRPAVLTPTPRDVWAAVADALAAVPYPWRVRLHLRQHGTTWEYHWQIRAHPADPVPWAALWQALPLAAPSERPGPTWSLDLYALLEHPAEGRAGHWEWRYADAAQGIAEWCPTVLVCTPPAAPRFGG